LKFEWAEITEKLDPGKGKKFLEFIQKAANRLAVGAARYGRMNPKRRYMRRMELEVRAYHKNGNIEHLYNVCNYAFLESFYPENPRSHYDAHVKSTTRGKV